MTTDAEWDWEEEEEGDAESFIAEYELDEAAAHALRAQCSEVVKNVISQGPLVGNNPSAILMSRIRQATSCAATDWESFLEVVDESAREQFLALDRQVMDAVMEEGPLNGNNPSAILVGRIRKARQSLDANGSKTVDASKRATDADIASRRRASALGGGPASRGAAQQQVVRRQAQQQAPQKRQVRESGQSWPQGQALQHLASLLCHVNSAMWDLDVPHEDVVATVKEALKARKAAVAAVAEAEWPEEAWPEDDSAKQVEPPKKKAKSTTSNGGGAMPQARELPKDERELRQVEVLQEVLRLLQKAGGTMALQNLGSKELTDLRKGAVGNLGKFLSSCPEAVTMEASGPNKMMMVSLA